MELKRPITYASPALKNHVMTFIKHQCSTAKSVRDTDEWDSLAKFMDFMKLCKYLQDKYK